jgi:hypothetical protein
MVDTESNEAKTWETLGNEARQSFFQLENLIFHIDAKALGMVAINALFITFSTYLFKENSVKTWYIISFIFGASVFFMLLCIAPRYYDHRCPSSVINNSTESSSDQVSEQMARDYAWAFDNVSTYIYDEKVQFFTIGFVTTIIGIVLLCVFILDI